MRQLRCENRWVLRFEKGEEVISSLMNFCRENNIKAANITGIGATNDVKFGLFDVDSKEYNSTEVKENLEITSLMGTVTEMNNEPYLHIHINVANKEGIVKGGHLNSCIVSATCEMVLDLIGGKIDRFHDDDIGLNLFAI